MKTFAKQAFDRTLGAVLTRPCELFFAVVALLILAPMLTSTLTFLYNPRFSLAVNVLALYLIILFVSVRFHKISSSQSTAKDYFKAVVLYPGYIALIAGIGDMEIRFFIWLLF
jgi:hypothetical protein